LFFATALALSQVTTTPVGVAITSRLGSPQTKALVEPRAFITRR